VDSAKKYHADLTEFARDAWSGVQQGRIMDADTVRESVGVMVDSISRNPDAFVWLARVKDYDSYTYAHAVNVAAWCTLFGRRLGFPTKSLEDLAAGGLFLDIGNIKLPKQVLEKSGRLTDEEWQLVKTHVGHSVDLLRATEGIPDSIVEMVGAHHERYDGSGYPRGLEGDEIPLYGQIAGIVDFYVSVTFPRPAGKAVSSDFALNVLFKQRNVFFKSELVAQFIRVIGLYPAGSLVELSTGEVAVVLCQHPTRRLRPRVMLVLAPETKPYDSYPIVDLVKETEDRHGRPLAIRRGVRDGEYRIDFSRLPF
jgi:HD-GYP domain-containing protein (c-di-GMP phosphodiesterase class II)